MPSGQLAAPLKPAAELCVVALGHVFDERRGHAGFGSCRPTIGVINVADIAGTDVFADRELVAAEVLEDNANALAQCFDVPVPQVQSVEQDVAFGRFVQTGEQLDQCCLAGAVLTNQRQALARTYLKTDISERLGRPSPDRRTKRFELETTLGLGSVFCFAARRGHGLFEVVVQVG